MTSHTQPALVSRNMLRAGFVISALPVLVLVIGAGVKLMKPKFFVDAFNDLGWNESLALSIGILELACTVVYVIPRTAVLGAILLTGYLGGAIAAHVRIGDPFFGQIIFGVLVWGGVYLRDARLRALLPLRS